MNGFSHILNILYLAEILKQFHLLFIIEKYFFCLFLYFIALCTSIRGDRSGTGTNGERSFFYFSFMNGERKIFIVFVQSFFSSKILKMQTTTPGLSRAVHYAAQYCNEIISRLFISYWQQNVIYRKS